MVECLEGFHDLGVYPRVPTLLERLPPRSRGKEGIRCVWQVTHCLRTCPFYRIVLDARRLTAHENREDVQRSLEADQSKSENHHAFPRLRILSAVSPNIERQVVTFWAHACHRRLHGPQVSPVVLHSFRVHLKHPVVEEPLEKRRGLQERHCPRGAGSIAHGASRPIHDDGFPRIIMALQGDLHVVQWDLSEHMCQPVTA